MAISSKYGKVTTEKGDIPEDEPVFIFRPKDGFAVEALNHYWALCRDGGASEEFLDSLEYAVHQIDRWTDEVKIPD
jgi:hypothetical protein